MAKTEAQMRSIRKWEAENYEKVTLMLPKGTKDRIKATGNTINGIGVKAILKELESIEKDGN